MNQISPYNSDVHQQHMATTHAHPPSAGSATALGHYSSYQNPLLQPGHGSYSSASTYGGYPYPTYSAAQPVTSSMSHALVPQSHTLPAMSSAPGPNPISGNQNYTFDTTGQIAPPGVKPRVTATLWEDEGSLCFQVEANGVCVARREDNHMINGTKLLNVAGMTRGRRDGILKSEKVRHVVKIGPMHLKGVWIPFDRALDFANKEKITEKLYPLFVHDIGALLYHPSNPSQPRPGVGAAGALSAIDRRRNDARYLPTTPQGPPSLHHHHSMSSSVVGSVATSHATARPGIDRAHTFPTPPASASSVMGMSSQAGSYDSWGNTNVSNIQGGQPLSIDTGLSNARSVPTTPASTPPVYSTPAGQQAQYPSQQLRFGGPLHSAPYPKTEMAPARAEDETEHDHDPEYTHTSAPYSARSNSYNYNPNSGAAPISGEVAQVSEDLAGSPHQNGSGRATPRTTTTSQPHWQHGYATPQRNPAPGSNVYNVIEPRGANGATDGYYHGSALSNGTIPSVKRSREDDDEDDDGSKRLKTESDGGPVGGSPYSVNRNRASISQRRR